MPIDPSLLAHLPSVVSGFPIESSLEGVADAAGDPAIQANATAIAAGLVIDPANDDFAYASVVKLRPGVFSDAFFRDWRDTFDAAACAQAGGVGGNAEAPIGGRDTFIGTCNGGIRTYHVWLPTTGLLVSVSGVSRLAEPIIAGLHD